MQKPALRPLTLSIVLPCRNEEASVERVVRAALAEGGRLAERLEVIAVDDGSTDSTAGIIDRLAGEDARVRAVHNVHSSGYGAALASGFRVATSDWVFYTDGDGQFDLAQLADAVRMRERCDVVVGYRERRVESSARILAGWSWTRLVNALFGLSVRDLDCAFKLLPRVVLHEGALLSTGALISAELLYRAQAAGLRIGEMPVRHLPRRGGRATGASVRVVARAFLELFTLSARIKAQAKQDPRP